MSSTDIATVQSFIAAINSHDVAAILQLMSDDHRFVDSAGTVEHDREKLNDGWHHYFRMFPDYYVQVDHILAENGMVAAFGKATGTFNGKRGLVPENRITMPAAWKAVVRNEKVSLWQVYCDWTEGMRIIEEDKRNA